MFHVPTMLVGALRRGRRTASGLLCAGLSALTLAGCASTRGTDRAVRHRIESDAPRALIQASNTVADAEAALRNNASVPPSLSLDLQGALIMATRYSRSLQSKRDQLYLSGLDTLAAVRQFGPQYAGTVGYVLDRPENGADRHTTALDLKADGILPSGGALGVRAGSSASSAAGGPTNDSRTTTYRTAASVELRQPLLAGAGYEASHAPLIQAQRDLLYSLRAFSLERQDFAIEILRSYHALLIQAAVVENTRQNKDQSTYLRRRSDALFKVRRAAAIDVLRAQQQELTASNSLAVAEAELDVLQRRFLIQLGVPVDTSVRLTGNIPEVRRLGLKIAACVDLALSRRLDLMTDADKLDDTRRQVRIARNALLPRAEAFGKAAVEGSSTESPADADLEDVLSAGVTVELPLDQRDERDALRRAEIDEQAARRGLDEKKDEIRVSVVQSFTALETLEETSRIELKNIDIARRRAEYSVLRFKSGELSNRDVVEAQGELLSAQNAYVRALAQYEQQRVQLLRDIGLLDVAADGTIIELPFEPPKEARK